VTLVVVRVVGLVTVQDRGRPGHMHEGLAPGGALVPELLAAANRRAQNPDDAAAVEVMGLVTVRAHDHTCVATDTMAARDLQPGEELTIASVHRRVTYLAVRGGVDVPIVLGSRSAQLSAGLGQLLRAGARIVAGQEPVSFVAPEPFLEGIPVRVTAGPDLDAFAPGAVELLTSARWLVSAASNRVGTRLEGPVLPRSAVAELSRPMVLGAIEVPLDGQPIVLGPEHPTTGGYPVVAVVSHRDMGRCFATRIGREVFFLLDQ